MKILSYLGLTTTLALLLGCTATPVDLSQKKLSSVKLFSWSGPQYCPGRPFQLGLEVFTDTGERYLSRKAGDPQNQGFALDDFEFTAAGATVERDGTVTNHDVLATIERPLEVDVRYRRDASLRATSSFNPRYDCDRQHLVKGPEGPRGNDGSTGTDGQPGLDGRNGAPGADGEDGSDGKAGGPGGLGAPGPDLKLSLGLIKTVWNNYVVLIRLDDGLHSSWKLVAAGNAENYLVSNQGGVGGRGGDGGTGGKGGDGGNSNNGAQPGKGGNGGKAGDGGLGGNGGAGGRMEVFYDERHPELIQWLRFSNPGGPGGPGGLGGKGGWQGRGGTSSSEDGDLEGEDGTLGPDGNSAVPGNRGEAGPLITTTPAPAVDLFPKEMALGLLFL
jgi:hypothetical protein